MPVSTVLRPCAKASQPTMVAISCTRVFVSRAVVELDLRVLSLARTHGCWETWTLGGKGAAMIQVVWSRSFDSFK